VDRFGVITEAVPWRRLAEEGTSVTDPDDSLQVPPQARGLGLKEARRLAKAAGKGKLPAPG
jgi:hypothetical protein